MLKQSAWILLIPVALAGVLLTWEPFPTVVDQVSVSLTDLSPAQRQNIAQVAHALDGTVMQPDQLLSFNRIVGPRWAGRGFQPAKVYIEADTPESVGGGICVVSSLMYHLALRQGLTVHSRTAHTRPSRLIPPGLDATVWYGKITQADLVLSNPFDKPLQWQVKLESQRLRIALAGSKSQQARKIHRNVHKSGQSLIARTWVETPNAQPKLVSEDHYIIH